MEAGDAGKKKAAVMRGEQKHKRKGGTKVKNGSHREMQIEQEELSRKSEGKRTERMEGMIKEGDRRGVRGEGGAEGERVRVFYWCCSSKLPNSRRTICWLLS
jgi:hypothetical protein